MVPPLHGPATVLVLELGRLGSNFRLSPTETPTSHLPLNVKTFS